MSLRTPDLLFTAIAPAIWGSTYIVTTQYLPNFSPMTVAMLRALPAGLLLVMIVRQIPTGIWWMRIFILGALNISLFWSLLFISVYRLPGGVAATVGAVQPLMVVFISAALLGSPIRLMAVLGAICGTAGVALLVLTPNAALDPVGVAAGLAVAGCITWTPTYYTTIYGLQGRYFLPALPLGLLALRPVNFTRTGSDQTLCAAFALADLGVLLNAFLAILAR